ncbi:Anti-sigma regulatory factor (Ser/Thr protein kinase) [Streptomyces zhaozhouensis]|uniref:Anti-sigma regulatory factor (Ser/Thr protein kinase) n=1 Tax=Streptomyces zhaozhouensis TaxID=1300267 RepID=A0A286DTW1_9ACTN|nr:ATP-binding protein [Streptomyces zhaozhouensis]SOD62098.1 Anti-sigma regulatory factor (Ser/Thr protein kinase) [Streptomyces zhaozhouensis]
MGREEVGERWPGAGVTWPQASETLACRGLLRSVLLAASSPASCRAAREAARETLRDWQLEVSADDVVLCTSELVGNAVHHARPVGNSPAPTRDHRLLVSFQVASGHLFVGVADDDSTPPVLPQSDFPLPGALLSERGRGLLLVQVVADAVWWSPRHGGGKSVFCRFDLKDRDKRGKR